MTDYTPLSLPYLFCITTARLCIVKPDVYYFHSARDEPCKHKIFRVEIETAQYQVVSQARA
ncbi:hypothetical protein, partial [Chryseobacterium contaminans]|uniref:hypothetical protein n=1 Tax=Chryseobacterium contaminans TaxID=1423959 RepID=UPI001E544D04